MGNANLVNQLLQLKSLIARLQISLLEAVCVIKEKKLHNLWLLFIKFSRKKKKKKTQSTAAVVIKFPCTRLV